MRRALVGALAASALALAAASGCGGDYSDLIAIRRTGSLPDARMEVVVNDGGTARCDGGRAREMRPRLLLDARDIVRELTPELREETVHPRPPNALLRFEVVTAEGEMTFSDTDGSRNPDLARLVQLTRTVAQEVCGLER